MTPAESASDRLLDSLGSSTPQVTDRLSRVLLAWRDAIEAWPMPEWVTV